MKSVRLIVICLLAVVVIAVAWRTTRTRAFHKASQPVDAEKVAAAPQSAAPLASVPKPSGSQSAALGSATSAAVVEERVTEQRLGPFSISGSNYTVVLHKKHLAASENNAPADGVVAMEVVDAAGAVLYKRTFPLWADAEGVSAWKIYVRALLGTNGTGLLVKSGPDVTSSDPDPESNASYSQIFGVVNGKFVPFSGPFSGMVGKSDASGAYRTVGALGPQADELRLALGTGRFVRLTNDLMDYQLCCLDLTLDGKTLVDTELTTTSELWVAPAADTSQAKQITSKDSTVGRFSWTENGGFVFASADDNLFALNPDGSARTLLTPNDRGNQDPSACGDGRSIVYAAFREQKLGIWRMDADGSNPIRIADETVAQNPQCSPDGKWVVYLRGPTWIPVRVAVIGTAQPEVLSQDLVTGFGYSLEISSDGSQIMYVASPDFPAGSPATPSTSRPNQLKVIPFSGGAPLHQLEWPASASNPRWSPGGDAFDYVLARNGVSNIWRQKLTGGRPKQITNFQSGLIFDFHWSRDGKQLALARGSQTSNVILISNFR